MIFTSNSFSCSYRIRDFFLFPLIAYAVMFTSVFISFLALLLIDVGLSFVIISTAFLKEVLLFQRLVIRLCCCRSIF